MVVLVLIAGLLLRVVIFAIAAWIVAMNINDMIAVGVNFWNVLWTLLATSLVIGSAFSATK